MYKVSYQGLTYELFEQEAVLTGVGAGTQFVVGFPDVEIPQYVNNLPVTKIAANAFEKLNLRTVTLPNTLKEISTCAFLGCQYLTEIRMSSAMLNTNIVRICASAFAYCFSLEEVDICCALEIESRAFLACDKLKKLSGIIILVEPNAFRDCHRIYMLNLQHNAAVGFYAFQNCTIENIRCLGDIVISEIDIKELIYNKTTVYCYSDSKTTELAYLGVAVNCVSRK